MFIGAEIDGGKPVLAGDNAVAVIRIERLRRCSATITPELLVPSREEGSSSTPQSIMFKSFSTPEIDTVDEVRMIQRELHVPWYVTTGPVFYRQHVEFVCNFMQRLWPILFTSPSVQFEVTGPQNPHRKMRLRLESKRGAPT